MAAYQIGRLKDEHNVAILRGDYNAEILRGDPIPETAKYAMARADLLSDYFSEVFSRFEADSWARACEHYATWFAIQQWKLAQSMQSSSSI